MGRSVAGPYDIKARRWMCQHWPMFRSFLDRISRAGPQRTSGSPTSSNGASSFHLFWDVPPESLREVSVTIEVIEPPTVDKLYFWALQASVEGAGGLRFGGAHFGLQHHPSYPGAGAVNWGGYRDGGGELDGSTSPLPSAFSRPPSRCSIPVTRLGC